MKITLPQYISNPQGGRVMSNTQVYRSMYQSKLDPLLLRENNEIPIVLFKDSNSKYVVYIKVPSESTKGFFYDVAIEFTSNDAKEINSSSLKNYNVRFFSNEPGFVFNFCYSFIQNHIFFDDLESKMGKLAKTQAAVVTNKNNQVGYAKSIYFAYLIIEQRGLWNKDLYQTKYSQSNLIKMVKHSDVVLANRQQLAANQKLKASKSTNKVQSDKIRDNRTISSSRASSVRKTSTVSSAKKVKRI